MSGSFEGRGRGGVQEGALSQADRRALLKQRLHGAAGGAPVTAEALAAELGVSVRTLYRDIEILRSKGAPIEGAPGVGYRLSRVSPGDPTRFTAVLKEREPEPTPLRVAIRERRLAEEAPLAAALAEEARIADPLAAEKVKAETRRLVEKIRAARRNEGGVDKFMAEYALSSEEGVALMCLAESLLRIPDAETADRLIEDKIAGQDWARHFGHADSLFVNASTLGLMVSGRLLAAGEGEGLSGVLGRLIQRSGEPVIRAAIRQAMRIMGGQFVMGRTIGAALERVEASRAPENRTSPVRASFDMLGEAAHTMADARRYRAAYLGAIRAVGEASQGRGPIAADGVSIKLSALHPRYEEAQRDRADEVYEALLEAAEAAARADIGLCVDAEEADRLEYSLDLIERLALEPSLEGWDGLGLAVQAYQRRARPLIDWLEDLAGRSGRRLMVRLVKGAYWDTEIKRAQEAGLASFPVFTRKAHTDVSYLACARALFAGGPAFYPCFATHNAQTIASLRALAGDRPAAGVGGRAETGWELQRLHGMGAPLYEALSGIGIEAPCRVYAPVGGHEDLLAYLVRRLLENGANSSFVNRIVDDALPVEEIARDPAEIAAGFGFQPHPRIKPPSEMFAPRRNSAGYDLSDRDALARLAAGASALEAPAKTVRGRPALAAAEDCEAGARAKKIYNPADRSLLVGTVREANAEEASRALDAAIEAQPAWDAAGAEARASALERAADRFEAEGVGLMRLLVREAGKSWPDAVAELREAVDFLRYYAMEARKLFGAESALPGPTGERNTIRMRGRGAWLCISPWNFPLAIFTGQIAAALAAGGSVLAKPAEQTPLIALEAVRLLRWSGVPAKALHLLPGDGARIAAPLLADPRLAGVAFTGSHETAKKIERALAARRGPIAPLIAETGGINAMIVDSSALPEQVTRDVIRSAFQSAGQRCSALRILYLQEECAERQIEMLKGAMAELRVGDPAWLSTDVGPLIDDEALEGVAGHCARLEAEGRLIARTPLPDDLPEGAWIAPQAFEVAGIEALEREVFGPVLHVARWRADALDGVVAAINASGYGLTLGVHSRIERRWRRIAQTAKVGNIYVNRNQIGAVVGAQPFGGEGLSGTGPKAGGPHYLARFGVERTLSADLTAQGGDAALMTLDA